MTGVVRDDDVSTFYKDVFRALPMVSFLTDRRGVILDASDTAASLLNVERRVLRAKRLLHFVARGDTRTFRKRVNDLPAAAVEPFAAALRPRHGKPCPMTMTPTIVRDGSAVLWIAVPGGAGAPAVDDLVDRSDTAALATGDPRSHVERASPSIAAESNNNQDGDPAAR
ncbi:MAG TPA: hypothetical protein VE987_09600 [Polyangiaceae bacterium]|nr:hypothetical protein [Polyangiaceae bacterium]